MYFKSGSAGQISSIEMLMAFELEKDVLVALRQLTGRFWMRSVF